MVNKRMGRESHFLSQLHDKVYPVYENVSNEGEGMVYVHLPREYAGQKVRVVVWVEGRIKREVEKMEVKENG